MNTSVKNKFSIIPLKKNPAGDNITTCFVLFLMLGDFPDVLQDSGDFPDSTFIPHGIKEKGHFFLCPERQLRSERIVQMRGMPVAFSAEGTEGNSVVQIDGPAGKAVE